MASSKQGFGCPGGTGCTDGLSEAILSKYKNVVYMLIEFDGQFLFYEISIQSGQAINGYKAVTAAGGTISSLSESNKRLYLGFSYADYIILVYNTTTDAFDYKYTIQGSAIKSYSMIATDSDFIFTVGGFPGTTKASLLKTYYSALFALSFASNTTYTMTSYSSGIYQLQLGLTDSELSYNVYVGSYFTAWSFSLYDVSSSTNTDYFSMSVWNLDYYAPDIYPNSNYELDFTWT